MFLTNLIGLPSNCKLGPKFAVGAALMGSKNPVGLLIFSDAIHERHH
jgi:hypothetical protein